MIRCCQTCGAEMEYFADEIKHIDDPLNPNTPFHSLEGTYDYCSYCGEIKHIDEGRYEGGGHSSLFFCSKEHKRRWIEERMK